MRGQGDEWNLGTRCLILKASIKEVKYVFLKKTHNEQLNLYNCINFKGHKIQNFKTKAVFFFKVNPFLNKNKTEKFLECSARYVSIVIAYCVYSF